MFANENAKQHWGECKTWRPVTISYRSSSWWNLTVCYTHHTYSTEYSSLQYNTGTQSSSYYNECSVLITSILQKYFVLISTTLHEHPVLITSIIHEYYYSFTTTLHKYSVLITALSQEYSVLITSITHKYSAVIIWIIHEYTIVITTILQNSVLITKSSQESYDKKQTQTDITEEQVLW